MSTDYRTLKKVSAQELFDGRLEEYGVHEHLSPSTTIHGWRCLADGNNYMWASISEDGSVNTVTRNAGSGDPGTILRAIAEEFDTDIVSEHEPQYWGFQIQEEWDAAWEQMGREHREKFHLELMKYLRGEPNDIRRGTVGMIQAEIAKELVEKDPTLLLLTNKDKLHDEINTVERNRAVTFTLGPKPLTAADLSIAREDDLPF